MKNLLKNYLGKKIKVEPHYGIFTVIDVTDNYFVVTRKGTLVTKKYIPYTSIYIMEEVFEVIGVEHLKTILSGLTPEDIVKPAYDNWFPMQKTGHTVLDLETGKVSGLSIEHNQMPLQSMMYIELYTIKAGDYPIGPEELFSKTEYEEFMDFMEDEPSEFAPDMVSIFCEENDIDEDSRTVGILA